MTTHVQTASNGSAPTTNTIVTPSPATTAGNYLTCSVYSGSSAALTLTSITDSSGGTNVWHWSSATSNNSPPASQVHDTTNSTYCLSAIGWCQTTVSATTVTATMSGSADTWLWAAVDEWASVPAGATAVGLADATDYISQTSWTSPAITAPAGSLLVVTAVTFTGFSAANTAGYTLEAGSSHYGGWALPSSPGSYACNFTQASGNIGGSSTLVIGQFGTNTSPVWGASQDVTAVAGTGTWTNAGNVTGAADSSWATWTAP